MLRSMRASAQGWLGRAAMALILVLIIPSFAIWGIGNIFQGFGANDLARVGRIEIGADTFRNTFQTELQRQQRLERRNITSEEAHQSGLDRQVLSRLVAEAALDDQARTLGLAMSDVAIKQAIMGDDAFKGMNGSFDPRLLAAFLREEGFTEKSYVQNQRAVYLRRQIIESLTAGLELPKALQEAIFRFQMEGRGVDYIVLPFSSVGQIPNPAAKELELFFDNNRAFYAVPEYRSLVVLALTPKSIAKPEAVSDDDARARYDEIRYERFGTPEKREVEQILFGSEAQANEAYRDLSSGKTFDDLLKEKNLTPKDASLGLVAQSGLVDKAVAEAAFSLKKDEVSPPVQAQFGTVLLRVRKIVPSTVKPFEEVAAQIKEEIAQKRAESEIGKLHDAIEDQRTSGKSLTEAAQSVGLEPRAIPAIDSAGNDLQGAPVKDLEDGTALLKAAFASDVGVDNDTLRLPGGGYQWFEVARVNKARDKTLNEARADVEKAWREEEAGKRLAAKTAELVKKLDSGETIAAIASAEGNLPVKHASDVRRGLASGLAVNFVNEIFKVNVHRAGTAANEEGGAYLFVVTGSSVPPFDPHSPELANITADAKSGYAQDLDAQYLAKLESNVGMKLNAKAFAAATGVSPDSP
ncbi:MAG: SurA N-terminal domain-containing protein [Methylocapsa sp.]|nr:SurA N-terminal domain-containing protein [Methylocapsa sp.]